MKNIILVIGLFLMGCLNSFGQSSIQMFQIIQKPIDIIYADSLNWEDTTIQITQTIEELYGDSTELSGVVVISDTLDAHQLFISVGIQEGDSSIVYDSIYVQNIPTIESEDTPVFRQGRVVYLDWGIKAKPLTIFGHVFIKDEDGEAGEIKYFE